MIWYSLPTTSHLLYVLCYCFLHLHHHLFFTLIIVLLITTSTTTTDFNIMTFWPQVISTTSSSSSRVRLRPGRLLRDDHWHNQLPHAQSPRRHSRRWNPPSTVKIQPNYQISTITPKRWKWSQSQCTPRCLAEISMMLSSFNLFMFTTFLASTTKFYLAINAGLKFTWASGWRIFVVDDDWFEFAALPFHLLEQHDRLWGWSQAFLFLANPSEIG